jgi:hypothetical protein
VNLRVIICGATLLLVLHPYQAQSASNYWKDARPIANISVTRSSPDSLTRLISYRSALAAAFPEVKQDSFCLYAEVASDMGSIAKLMQMHYGFPVMGGTASVLMNSKDQAVYASTRYHQNVNLSWDSRLIILDDSLATDSLARSLWTDLDTVAIEHCKLSDQMARDALLL